MIIVPEDIDIVFLKTKKDGQNCEINLGPMNTVQNNVLFPLKVVQAGLVPGLVVKQDTISNKEQERRRLARD